MAAAGVTSAIIIHVAGVPRPLPRPRFVNGRAVSVTDKKARAWARAIEGACPRDRRMDGACRVSCSFYFPTPRAERWGIPHTARPDTDNLLKLVLDSLERGGVLARGDARAASVAGKKLWSRGAGAVIEVRPWAQEKAPRAG